MISTFPTLFTGATLSRRTLLGSSAILGAMALAGCGSNDDNGGAKASGGKPSGTLNLWYTPSPGQSAAKSRNAFETYQVKPYNELYPDVDVVPSPIDSNSIAQKIQVALASGAGPDLVPTSGPSNSVPLAKAGYLATLDEAAQKYNWKEKVLPWALDLGYYDGHLVTLPTSYESLVLFYNKTLFEKNGWQPPTSRETLEQLIQEMAAQEIIPFAGGNASYERNTGHYVSAFLNAYAGPEKLHSILSGDTPWTDEAIVGATNLLKEYFDAGYIGGGVKQYFTAQDPQVFAHFAQGKTGMYMSGTWQTTNLPNYFGVEGNTNEWDWAPLPPLSEGVPQDIYPLAIGGTMSVNAKSKNLDAAIAYLGWYFSDTKTMWANAQATGAEPLPIKYSQSDVPSGIDPRYDRMYQKINDASEKGNIGFVNWTSFGPKADTYLPVSFDKVLNGSLSVEDYCAGIDKAFKQDFSAGLIPPLFKVGRG